MELTPDKGDGLHIRSYHAGQIETDEAVYSTSIIITPQQITIWRPETLSDLTEEDLISLLAFKPKIVLLGTGTLLKFPPVTLWRRFIEKNIGYEVIDTAAACRTYNVLMAENRAVVAGLIC
jgi:uncharacterized protein